MCSFSRYSFFVPPSLTHAPFSCVWDPPKPRSSAQAPPGVGRQAPSNGGYATGRSKLLLGWRRTSRSSRLRLATRLCFADCFAAPTEAGSLRSRLASQDVVCRGSRCCLPVGLTGLRPYLLSATPLSRFACAHHSFLVSWFVPHHSTRQSWCVVYVFHCVVFTSPSIQASFLSLSVSRCTGVSIPHVGISFLNTSIRHSNTGACGAATPHKASLCGRFATLFFRFYGELTFEPVSSRFNIKSRKEISRNINGNCSYKSLQIL